MIDYLEILKAMQTLYLLSENEKAAVAWAVQQLEKPDAAGNPTTSTD